MASRQIALDTETTGLQVADGHRVIEIACVEIVDRYITGKAFHVRLNPDRAVDPEATAVHGLRDFDLRHEKRFGEIVEDLLKFVGDAEVIIHNAAFDLGFLDREFTRSGTSPLIREMCKVTDTLQLARQRYPGQTNSLDALCRRLGVDTSSRILHGAMVDAQILAEAYLALTRHQHGLGITSDVESARSKPGRVLAALMASRDEPLRVIRATDSEMECHKVRMADLHQRHLKALRKAIPELTSQLKQATADSSDTSKSAADRRQARSALAELPAIIERTEIELIAVETNPPPVL